MADISRDPQADHGSGADFGNYIMPGSSKAGVTSSEFLRSAGVANQDTIPVSELPDRLENLGWTAREDRIDGKTASMNADSPLIIPPLPLDAREEGKALEPAEAIGDVLNGSRTGEELRASLERLVKSMDGMPISKAENLVQQLNETFGSGQLPRISFEAHSKHGELAALTVNKIIGNGRSIVMQIPTGRAGTEVYLNSRDDSGVYRRQDVSPGMQARLQDEIAQMFRRRK